MLYGKMAPGRLPFHASEPKVLLSFQLLEGFSLERPAGPRATIVSRRGIDLKLSSFCQNGSWPVVVPVSRRDRPEIGSVPPEWQLAGCRPRFEAGDKPEIGFVPPEWQLAGCRSRFEAGDKPEIGFVPSEWQNRDLSWNARNPGNWRQFGVSSNSRSEPQL
jgi:hypothetical protein